MEVSLRRSLRLVTLKLLSLSVISVVLVAGATAAPAHADSPAFPSNAIWTWDDGTYQAWMGPGEWDEYGYHHNLHIQWEGGGSDLYNYHFRFDGDDGVNYNWDAMECINWTDDTAQQNDGQTPTDASYNAAWTFYDVIGNATGLWQMALRLMEDYTGPGADIPVLPEVLRDALNVGLYG
jgi:hypothetical protein